MLYLIDPLKCRLAKIEFNDDNSENLKKDHLLVGSLPSHRLRQQTFAVTCKKSPTMSGLWHNLNLLRSHRLIRNVSPQLGSQSQVRATMSPQDQQDAVPEQSPISSPTSATSHTVAKCQSSPQRTRSGRAVVKPMYLDYYTH